MVISTLAYTIPRGMVIVWVLVFALRLVFMLFVAYSNSRLAQRAWPFTKVHTLDPANFLRLCFVCAACWNDSFYPAARR